VQVNTWSRPPFQIFETFSCDKYTDPIYGSFCTKALSSYALWQLFYFPFSTIKVSVSFWRLEMEDDREVSREASRKAVAQSLFEWS
jgi:hypothetical protein